MAHFHSVRGRNIDLGEGGKVAATKDARNRLNTLVFSAESLTPNLGFVFSINKLKQEDIAVGVTARDPSTLPTVPNMAFAVPDGHVTNGGYLYRSGQEVGRYDDPLDVKVGERVEVKLTASGEVFIYRDGDRKGSLCVDIHGPVWVMVSLELVHEISVIQTDLASQIENLEAALVGSGDARQVLDRLGGVMAACQRADDNELEAATPQAIGAMAGAVFANRSAPDLQEYLIGPDMRGVVTRMLRASVTPSEVLKALTEAAQPEGGGGDLQGRVDQARRIINKWFCDDSGGLSFPTQPGFLQSLHEFLEACAGMSGEGGGGDLSSLDRSLVPVVRSSLPNETAQTLQASHALFRLAVDWCLPGVVQELLESDNTDPNVRFDDCQGKSAVMVALERYAAEKERAADVERMVTSLIQCQRTDLSQTDSLDRTLVHYLSNICKNDQNIIKVIGWVELMGSKVSLNSELRAKILLEITKLELKPENREPFKRAVKQLVTPEFFDVNTPSETEMAPIIKILISAKPCRSENEAAVIAAAAMLESDVTRVTTTDANGSSVCDYCLSMLTDARQHRVGLTLLASLATNPSLTSQMTWHCLRAIPKMEPCPDPALVTKIAKALVAHPNFVAGATLPNGSSPFLGFLDGAEQLGVCAESYHMVSAALFESPRTQVVGGAVGRTRSPVQKCLAVCRRGTGRESGLRLLADLSLNPNLAPDIAAHCLAELIEVQPGSELNQTYKQTFRALAARADINAVVDDDLEMTLGHKAALAGNMAAMEAIMDVPGYDCCRRDHEGATALFYVCLKFPAPNAMDIVERGHNALKITNNAGRNLYDYYCNQAERDPELLAFIAKKMDA